MVSFLPPPPPPKKHTHPQQQNTHDAMVSSAKITKSYTSLSIYTHMQFSINVSQINGITITQMLWLQNAKVRPARTHPPEITTIYNLLPSQHPSLSDRTAGNDATFRPACVHTCLATQNKTKNNPARVQAQRWQNRRANQSLLWSHWRRMTTHWPPPPPPPPRSHQHLHVYAVAPAQRIYVEVRVHESISSSSSQLAPRFTMMFWAKPSSLITDGVRSLVAQVTHSFSHAPFSPFA